MEKFVLGLRANDDGVAAALEGGGDELGVLLVGDGGDLDDGLAGERKRRGGAGVRGGCGFGRGDGRGEDADRRRDDGDGDGLVWWLGGAVDGGVEGAAGGGFGGADGGDCGGRICGDGDRSVAGAEGVSETEEDGAEQSEGEEETEDGRGAEGELAGRRLLGGGVVMTGVEAGVFGFQGAGAMLHGAGFGRVEERVHGTRTWVRVGCMAGWPVAVDGLETEEEAGGGLGAEAADPVGEIVLVVIGCGVEELTELCADAEVLAEDEGFGADFVVGG